MTRDEALKIARRIMDRIEQDRAIHLDAMADEIVAGMAIAERVDEARHKTPPCVYTGARVSKEACVKNGWTSEIMLKHGYALDPWSDHWIHPRGLGDAASEKVQMAQYAGVSDCAGIWRITKAPYGSTYKSVGIDPARPGSDKTVITVVDDVMHQIDDAEFKRHWAKYGIK